MICKHVYYSGRVQGVGFRYTARSIARGYAVAGFVRNLPGGEVELVAEGKQDQVDAYLQALAARMNNNIQDVRVEDETPGNYQGFDIRY